MQDQHEYLADQAVLQTYTPQQYGQLLLRQVQVHTYTAPVHSIFHSPIKKRILMMTSHVSATRQVARYFFFLPLVFCTQYFPLQAQATVAQAKPTRHKPVVVSDTIITIDPETYHETMRVVESSYYEAADVPAIYGKCDQGLTTDQLQTCSQQNLMQFLVAHLKYPESAKKAGIQGNVFVSFMIDETGKAGFPLVKKSLGPELDAEVLRVLALMDKWSPALVEGKPVRLRYALPVAFRL